MPGDYAEESLDEQGILYPPTDRPADAPKAMGEGPLDFFKPYVSDAGDAILVLSPCYNIPRPVRKDDAEIAAKRSNELLSDWLRVKGWAAPEEAERLRIQLAACGVAAIQNTRGSAKERLTPDNPYWSASYGDVCRAVDREMDLREELSALKEKAAILYEVLCERGEHDSDCIRGFYRGGRPTGSGGYEVQYGEKWYQLRPVDQTPNCNCGLEGAIAAYAKAEGGKECRHYMPLDWNCNACSDSGNDPRKASI